MVSQKSDLESKPTFEDGRITVCVRARPLLGRERKASNHARCLRFDEGQQIQVLENTLAGNGKPLIPTTVTNIHGVNTSEEGTDPTNRRAPRVFAFDHAYDSDVNQEQVYTDIGAPMLNSSFHGYNTCVFAYGQTGSGKSYCMMGPEGGRRMDSNPGLIPRFCEALFQEMEARKTANAAEQAQVQAELTIRAESGASADEIAAYIDVHAPPELSIVVYVSYVEIYREKVRCLLHPDEAGPEKSMNPLRVREHPSLGVYIEGLKEVPVSNVSQVLELMRAGNRNRHTAATGMNDVSSRSHAIFALQLLQQRKRPGKDPSTTTTTELAARINLVDLAGSERVKTSGSEGETLKEGAQINKSLATLGLVISTLAENSRRSTAKHVPYRDSTLTFLLRESLGGNSKTFMLATVSPALVSVEETLSTLRYADRAKSILTRAFVNETASSKRIRELENEVVRLREKIRLLQAREEPSPGLGVSPTRAAVARLLSPSRESGGEEFDRESLDMEGMRSEMETMEEVMRRLTATNAEREQEVAAVLTAYKAESTVRINRNDPYLLNLDGVGGWVVAHLIGTEILLGDYAAGSAPEAAAAAAASLPPPPPSPSSGFDAQTTKPQTQRIVLCAGDYVDGPNSGSAPVIGTPHCILEVQPGGAFKVRPCAPHETYVNGELLSCSVPPVYFEALTLDSTQRPRTDVAPDVEAVAVLLQSGDVLSLGVDGPQLKFVDPTVPSMTARGRRPLFPMGASLSSIHVDPVGAEAQTPGREASRRGGNGATSSLPPQRVPSALGRARPVLNMQATRPSARTRTTALTPSESLTSPGAVVTFLDASLHKDRNADGNISPTFSQYSTTSTGSARRRPQVPALQLGNLVKPNHRLPGGANAHGPSAFAMTTGELNNRKSDAAESQDGAGVNTLLPKDPQGMVRSFSSRGIERCSEENVAYTSREVLQGRVVPFSSLANLDGSRSRAPLSARVLKGISMRPRSASISGSSHSLKLSADPERFIGGHNFVFLGPTQSGKTTTRENLKVPDRWYSFLVRDHMPIVGPTWGLQRSTLKVTGAETVELLLTELSGLPCFSVLQDHLPTRRVTYMLCFSLFTPNPSLEMFHQTLEYILCYSDYRDAAVVLLATHMDQYRCSEQELYGLLEGMGQQVHDFFELLQPNPELRPSIVGRFAVDNVRRRVFSAGFSKMRTVGDLLHWMGDHALHRCKNDLDFRHGRLPLRWERLRNLVLSLRVSPGKWYLPLSDYKSRAKTIDPRYGRAEELHIHTQLLSHLGVLEHRFRHMQMRSLVVLDVEWFMKLLACVACCGPISHGDPDLMVLCTSDLMHRFEKNRRLPFRWSEIMSADQYGLLSKGIFTTKVFQVLLAGILAEKGTERPPLSMIMNILESCDYIIRGSRLCFSMLPSSPHPSPYASKTEQQKTTVNRSNTEAAAYDEEEENDSGEVSPTHLESFLLLPTNFFHSPALAVIDYLPKLLTGPFYRFTFNMVPMHFFSKLTCRLAHAAAQKVYAGPVQRWRVDVDPPYMPLVEVDPTHPELSSGSTQSPSPHAGTPGKAIIPSEQRFWRNAVWAIGPAGNRAFIRMVHHSLFISFYSTGELAPEEGAAAGFFDSLLRLIREAIQESPGAQCQEGLLCATEHFAPGSWVFFPEAGEHGAKPTTQITTDPTSPRGDLVDPDSDEQPFACCYCIVDENINSFDKIREAEQYALQTARYRRTRESLRARSGVSLGEEGEDDEDDEEVELVPLLRNFSTRVDLDAFVEAVETNAGPPTDLRWKEILRQALEEWNAQLLEGVQASTFGRRRDRGMDEPNAIARHQRRLGRALDTVVDALARW